jgi:hypothetical protein
MGIPRLLVGLALLLMVAACIGAGVLLSRFYGRRIGIGMVVLTVFGPILTLVACVSLYLLVFLNSWNASVYSP